MPLWKTDEIVKLCSGIEGTTVTTQEPGGDWDTNEVVIKFDHLKEDEYADCLLLQGFGAFWLSSTPAFTDEQRDEVEVDDVVFRNRISDSDGGIQTRDPKVAAAGALITGRLQDAGFLIARHWKQLR
jgi:hypothetical protein